MRSKARNWRSGQSILLLVLALPVLLGVVSLAVDVSNLYFNWTELQAGADAAVLAGAAYLPAHPDQAKSSATSYALSNGIQSSEITSNTVAPDNTSLSMQVSRTVPFYFARVLGFSATPVTVNATAGVQSVSRANGVVPFGVDYRTSYTYDQTVDIKAGQVGAGNWEPLALGGTGASNYLNNLEQGYSGTVSIADTVQTEPGNIVGPTRTGVNYRINAGLNADPSGTFSSHTLDDPRVMLVAMVDFSSINGSSSVPVKGFAELWIVSVNGGTITTYFIQQTSPGTQTSSGIQGFGAFTPILMQ